MVGEPRFTSLIVIEVMHLQVGLKLFVKVWSTFLSTISFADCTLQKQKPQPGDMKL